MVAEPLEKGLGEDIEKGKVHCKLAYVIVQGIKLTVVDDNEQHIYSYHVVFVRWIWGITKSHQD